jgi:hypothetical protein
MAKRRVQSRHTFVLDPAVMCACGNRAIQFLEIHAMDFCTESEPTRAAFVCDACMARDVHRIEQILLDAAGFCATCYLPIVTMSDMIVKQCPIER